jgi:hypothetical protein
MLSPYMQRLLTLGVLLLLSTYIFVKRIAVSGALGFSDWLAMLTGNGQECTLSLSGAWTPIVTCLNSFLRVFIFPHPIIYLIVSMGLRIAILYTLYRIFAALAPNHYKPEHKSTLALMVLTFLVIGGGGRFLIGGSDLIISSSIYSGMWAQLLVLIALACFVNERVKTAGVIIALAVFIHPANTFNVFIILVVTLLMMFWSPKGVVRRSSILVFLVFGTTAILLQYLAAFGVPSLEFIRELSTAFNGLESPGLQSNIQRPAYSVNDWYTYILMQDPDDLSLIWLLSNKSGAFYLSFFLVGLAIAGKVEGTFQPKILLERLPIVLILSSMLYFIICALIEYFRFPVFALENLITVQPRRAFYLPVLFLSYYFVRYILEFFWQTEKLTFSRLIILLSVYSWFFMGLLLTTYGNHISTKVVIGVYLAGLTLIGVFYKAREQRALHIRPNILANTSFLVSAAIIAIVVKTSPFISTQMFSTVNTMFLDAGPRSFNEYLAIAAKLRGDESFKNHQELQDWMRSNMSPDSRSVSAGFSEPDIMMIKKLTKRSVLSLNVYRYRGGMHFVKSDFDERIHYFETLLGIPWTQMSATQGQLDGLQDIVEAMDEDHFRNMRISDDQDRPFDYFITRFPLKLRFPKIFESDDITVYQIQQSQ